MQSTIAVNARGFTLVETIFAVSLTAVALTALAQLFVLATRANADARRASLASILAVQKIEDLRSEGADLVPSGPGSLRANVPGSCDFLDQYGRSLGTGTLPLSGTVYVRRWSVELVPAAAEMFVLQVAVFPQSSRGTGNFASAAARASGGAHIVSIKTRRAG